jgi:hypothetical protein
VGCGTVAPPVKSPKTILLKGENGEVRWGRIVVWGVVTVALVAVVALFVVGVFSSPVKDDAETARPAEFLYLDTGRVLSYLAQMQGGATSSEQLQHKQTNSLTAKLAVKGLFEAGTSGETEDLTQREVTPTAASSFIELLEALEHENDVRHVHLEEIVSSEGDASGGDEEANAPRPIHEGEFVLFKSSAMRPPTYVNAYLAVRQSSTLSALFPMPSSNPVEREAVKRQREAARKFAKQVGDDPRIVFDLRPDGEDDEGPEYLLPVTYSQLTNERSLIKYGGGEFKVLGKVVRLFPESGREPLNKEEAYVDSPTRETWSRPLKRAIRPLLCRSQPSCLDQLGDEDAEQRKTTIEETRQAMTQALIEQSEIHREGAVILPVAIYK